MRKKPVLTSEDLHKIAAACRAEADGIGIKVTFCVVDDGGRLWFLERMDGVAPMSTEIATLKARSASVSRRPSGAWQERVSGEIAFLKLPEIFPVKGGVPVLIEGECCGGIGVSGGTGEQDEQIANAGLATLA
jgi:uncharacterized protein GlcG (DUF336 family)